MKNNQEENGSDVNVATPYFNLKMDSENSPTKLKESKQQRAAKTEFRYGEAEKPTTDDLKLPQIPEKLRKSEQRVAANKPNRGLTLRSNIYQIENSLSSFGGSQFGSGRMRKVN